jgi:hypothetical protein
MEQKELDKLTSAFFFGVAFLGMMIHLKPDEIETLNAFSVKEDCSEGENNDKLLKAKDLILKKAVVAAGGLMTMNMIFEQTLPLKDIAEFLAGKKQNIDTKTMLKVLNDFCKDVKNQPTKEEK